MYSHVVASIWTILLLSLLSLPVRVYVNVSLSGQYDDFHQPFHEGADAVVVLRPLNEKDWSFNPSSKKFPSVLEINQPNAQFVAVNFKQLSLLPGDKLVVRNSNGTMCAEITANTSSKIEASNKSPSSLLLRTHPFLVKGGRVIIEYFPSIATLTLPLVSSTRVVVDSYAYVIYNTSFVGTETESTIGATDDAKEAVCYRKTEPKMYAKARTVSRLMIRNDQKETFTNISDQVTSWIFCTGWLIGQGNYLITNHHCIKDAAVVTKDDQTLLKFLSTVLDRFWPRTLSPPDNSGRIVEAMVGFMAETKSCQEDGYMGEKAGVIEATKVAVVVENAVLDYALLRVLTNDSATDLAKRYGYLRLRAAGPVNGEAIYIPQHPRGEPKKIAAIKDGKPAVIEVLASNLTNISENLRRVASVTQPLVWYNADTEPGSSGSPVLSRKDNTVVALHRAGNPETLQTTSSELYNMGVRTDLIVRDLQQRKLLPKNSLASS